MRSDGASVPRTLQALREKEEPWDRAKKLRSKNYDGTKPLPRIKKGARTGVAQREELQAMARMRYERTKLSIRQLSEEMGRSYGFMFRLLEESGVQMRSRGGTRKKKSHLTVVPRAERRQG